jgi:hypothetical protein
LFGGEVYVQESSTGSEHQKNEMIVGGICAFFRSTRNDQD